MTWTVVWHNAAMGGMRRLRSASPAAARTILRAVAGLADDPEPAGASVLGSSELRRLRLSDARVMYRIDRHDRTVHILGVGQVPRREEF